MIFNLEIDIADPTGESVTEYDNDIYDEAHLMLAVLCAKDIVHIHNNELFVFCSDMFAWAMADLEPIKYEEIPELFYSWYKEQKFGDLKWIAKKRNLQPQEPVIEWIKKEGVWDEEWEALDFGYYNRYMAERRNRRLTENE